ncbi:hypothetical protein PJV97_09730 [Aliarcobacter butzleri]|uniref:hypothetical protein n=1 Tax=Aliarcobacter butzleri TaxID=28197 RepID=UPI00263EB64B|nr:hypothetical protein [Aliarcobacter butzleri]MDN5112624.1 hypothetical protein [Aliarcobacter butzleri]
MPESHKQPERGFKQLACEILDISTRSYSNFNKQKRLIITLLEKYFTKEDLEEFIDKNKVSRYEFINEYSFLCCIQFLEKLKLLRIKSSPSRYIYEYNYFHYFTNFILDYIKNGYNNENKQWNGTTNLHLFQNYFLDFSIDNQPEFNNSIKAIDFIYNQETIDLNNPINLESNTINTLRELSNFINNFKQKDLYFLNLCIQDNFTTLLNFYKSDDVKISYLQNDVSNFLNDLKNTLEKKLNISIDSIDNIENYIIQYKELVIS